GTVEGGLLRVLAAANLILMCLSRPLGRILDRPIRRFDRDHVVSRRFRARRGVVLAAGGFVFNRPLLARHAPAYRRGSSLGTIGDDGSGIALGEQVGGQDRKSVV